MKDPTGRFPERPSYPQEALDGLSEEWIVGFLVERYGKGEFPVSTNDLTVMIECDTSDLEQCVALSEEGEELQGVAPLYPGPETRGKDRPRACRLRSQGISGADDSYPRVRPCEVVHGAVAI